MKNLIKFTVFTFFIAFVFSACKKEVNQISYTGGTSPVLRASTAGPLVLNIADKNANGITFSWTNPNYTFTTGVSSQDVSYTLQVDTTGANFQSANLKELSVSKDLSLSLTVGALNTLLANWQENIPHNFEMRIKSTIGSNGAVPLYSNVVKLVITPYLDVSVVLPFTGNLFLIGSATPGGDATGWNNPVPTPSQQFTKTSSTTWEITIPLIGGKQYLILPNNGSWANKYAVDASKVTSDGGDFGYNFNDNFPGPATSGTYKIILNFKTGKFSVTKL